MHTAIDHSVKAILCSEMLLFVFSPLHQIKEPSSDYHIIPPTKVSSAHSTSLKAAAQNVISAVAVHHQQKLGYGYDYGDY